MLDLTVNEKQLQRTIERAREKNIMIPTLAQQRDPSTIPPAVQKRLKDIGLWDLNSFNLFRITWKNEPVHKGGLYGKVNYLELPPELTGVDARIVGLVGKWFPTGSHKVGATFGCLVPRLITGQFDPTTHKAVWPSTGNYCRGGAYNSALLACDSIAILPEGMSRERFEWLSQVAGEVIATTGSESNVKEIFDKCWELLRTRDNVMIFNQFDELGNYIWHYEVTAPAMEEVLQEIMTEKDSYQGLISATGSAGTIGAGDYLKKRFPGSRNVAVEALQCPTLLLNGFGDHRIEGIGDKHVPWIHNIRNTDMVIAVDDNDPMALLRLFNEPQGQEYLSRQGVPEDTIKRLPEMGISSVANMVAAIKYARHYELTSQDVIMTVFTDSMEMYQSRLKEMEEKEGPYTEERADGDYREHIMALSTDYMEELTYEARKRIHNLKYFTWIEQQGKELEELNAQWYDHEQYWGSLHNMSSALDSCIEEFNRETQLLAGLD